MNHRFLFSSSPEKGPQGPSPAAGQLQHQMQTSYQQSQSNREPVASGGFWPHFPMNLNHCAQCKHFYMSCSNSRPRPLPGAQRWSGWLCSQTWSQRTEQGSLRPFVDIINQSFGG